MQRLKYAVPIALVIAFIVYISFKGCSGFVAYFDGEQKERMVKLHKDFYYSKIDKSIWLKEDKTDSYKRILNERVDSLIWDSAIVIGYSGSRYFTINISSQELKYESNRNSISNFLRVNEFHTLEDVPGIRIDEIKK